MDFSELYASLNEQQREAVDHIDGPLLVIAGPGTGKTQLLSARAANIIKQGDVNPSNILCLTYTEAGATEMRSRLIRLMGNPGSEVSVHTFHSFGSWIINQYPVLFNAERSLKPLDGLGRFQLFEELLSGLPVRHAFAVRDETGRFIRAHSVQEAISVFKQAGLTPKELHALLRKNETEYRTFEPLLEEVFGTTLSAKRLPAIQEAIDTYLAKAKPHSYSAILLVTLEDALQASIEAGKTAALGSWRTKYTTIDNGKRILKSAASAQLLEDTITLYETYQKTLISRGLFDYEDMVLWAAKALESHEDMRFDVAERFQYIMVDEYQDTNGAQNRLLDAVLSANPLDTPNVMVVGDDDQAIMRFQGAEVSGMLAFVEKYNPDIIVLTDNYRSAQIILDASRRVMTQTDERLEVSLPQYRFTKQLTARSDRPNSLIEHTSYNSPASEYAAVAERIEGLIVAGVTPSEIGIIARKHAELTEFVPHALARGLQVSYERRENVLEHPAIIDLCNLAQYLARFCKDPTRADALLPTVLTGQYWELPPLALYELAAKAKAEQKTLLDTMLTYDDDSPWPGIAEWLIAAGGGCGTYNFTQMLDIAIGRTPLPQTKLHTSPYRRLYADQPPTVYTTLISHLICIRDAVLAHRPQAHGLQDFLDVVKLHLQSGVHLTDSNPLLRGDSDSIQLMSAHGSKGREFEHVFLLSTIDEVWGNRARTNNTRIRLPENLPLYPAGDNESDRLRLLYVAMTRAKSRLYFTSYTHTVAGKATTPLGFIAFGEENEAEPPAKWWSPTHVALNQEITGSALETSWHSHAIDARSLKQALQPALQNFSMSATALRDFLDLCYGGPLVSIERHVLRFPSSYSDRSALGSAVHKALQYAHSTYLEHHAFDMDKVIEKFNEYLETSGLEEAELTGVRKHGEQFLPIFLTRFAATDFANIMHTEQHLRATSPTLKVPLSGSVDAIASGPLRIIDYKTGLAPLPDWQTKGLSESKIVSLHFYRQQLLFYKLLVEQSRAYSTGERVSCAELVFVEPNDTNDIVRLAITDFTDSEISRTEALIKAVYDHIQLGKLPDVSKYGKDLKSIIRFENDLIEGNI